MKKVYESFITLIIIGFVIPQISLAVFSKSSSLNSWNYFFHKQTLLAQNLVACPNKVKLCPDGSYTPLSRKGPNCEFSCISEIENVNNLERILVKNKKDLDTAKRNNWISKYIGGVKGNKAKIEQLKSEIKNNIEKVLAGKRRLLIEAEKNLGMNQHERVATGYTGNVEGNERRIEQLKSDVKKLESQLNY